MHKTKYAKSLKNCRKYQQTAKNLAATAAAAEMPCKAEAVKVDEKSVEMWPKR